MDEPTAALGVKQAAAVLQIAKNIRDRGTSVVIISHILPHVLELADRIVVLRHGRKVADLPAGELDEHKLIEMIVGFRAPARSDAG
jgi:ABC-type sugar transport system ATPase subunit